MSEYIALPSDVLAQWQSLGAMQGLSSDVDIAIFLLKYFENTTKGQHQVEANCEKCQSPLFFYCLSCVDTGVLHTSSSNPCSSANTPSDRSKFSSTSGQMKGTPKLFDGETIDNSIHLLKSHEHDDGTSVGKTVSTGYSNSMRLDSGTADHFENSLFSTSPLSSSGPIDRQQSAHANNPRWKKTVASFSACKRKPGRPRKTISDKSQCPSHVTLESTPKCALVKRTTKVSNRERTELSKGEKGAVSEQKNLAPETDARNFAPCGRRFEQSLHKRSQAQPVMQSDNVDLEHLLDDDDPTSTHICSICSTEFSTANKLWKHKQRVHREPHIFLCNFCGKHLSCKQTLVIHERIHTGVKPYQCPSCPKTFRTASNLQIHLRSHTNETPYLCTECGMAFKDKPSLKRHSVCHTGAKPFKCRLCDKAYGHLSSLHSHKESVHSGSRKAFVCSYCGRTFSTSKSHKKHMVKFHKDQDTWRNSSFNTQYSCEICGAVYSRAINLVLHKRQHESQKVPTCPNCRLVFQNKYDLGRHQTIDGCGIARSKRFECDVCGAVYRRSGSLTKHIKRHDSGHLPVCRLCGTTFSNITELRRHKTKCSEVSTFVAVVQIQPVAELPSHRDSGVESLDPPSDQLCQNGVRLTNERSMAVTKINSNMLITLDVADVSSTVSPHSLFSPLMAKSAEKSAGFLSSLEHVQISNSLTSLSTS